MFTNKEEEIIFKNSKIMQTDNYKIIGIDEQEIQIMDYVILNTPYYLQSPEEAYQKSLIICNKHR